MIRLFEQHYIRYWNELDGIWKFQKEGDEKVYSLPVPGCWEQHPELLNFRGIGTYHKKIFVRGGSNLRLVFQGVSHTADVFLDGELLAHHYNAFTGFEIIKMHVKGGYHNLSVRVDNRFTEESALHVPNDYQTYGGIIRPVSMEMLPDCYLKNISFTASRDEFGWRASIKVQVQNLEAMNQKLTVRMEMVDESGGGLQAPLYRNIEIPADSVETCSWEQDFAKVKEWSTESPNLYYVKVYLLSESQHGIDDLFERVGFRDVKIENSKLLVNGNPVFLKGFNRHEDYGTTGSAVPFQNMVQDMDLMQEAGANAVRTCHYPNDPRFLDLCDERGMMVWEENHARGFDLKKMQNPHFEKQCHDCIEEMITQHYNHPSILIWGILNECASETEEGRRIYQEQYEQIESLDDTRVTTSATCRHFKDICLDLPDVVSFNMYSGWYEDVPVKERHEQEMDWIARAGGDGKPVIVSEFGAAAIYGYRDRGHCKWSEERQADVIRENLEVYRDDPRIIGTFIWQFADCKVTEEEWFSSRARCHNNKGLVDEYRRPKEAFDVVKELFPTMDAEKWKKEKEKA